MLYIDSPSTDPYFNLALEEYIFERMDRSQSYLMLWQNSNTIVVGKYQNTAEEINQSYVDTHGIRVVRRLSGGGAVYHDTGNLNFTFIMDQKENAGINFKMFVEPVMRALKEFGIQAEFSGRNDLTIDGMKFSGNSQYIKNQRVMHHGCIMLDSNLTTVSDALRVKEAKFDSKSVKSVRSRVTTINAHAKTPISMHDFKAALVSASMAGGDLAPYTLTKEDLAAVQKLRDEKYATWEWNFGHSPAYSVRREKKFSSGLVTAHLKVSHGCIEEIRIYGDFFGNGDIHDLETFLTGVPLDENLTLLLEQFPLDDYLRGIDAEDLSELLRG